MKTIALLLILLLTSCSHKLSEIIVVDAVTEVNFEPNAVSKVVSDKLTIEIAPINAQILDASTFSAIAQNRNYQDMLFPDFEAKRNENASLKRRYRDGRIEKKVRAFDAVDVLISGNRLSKEEGIRLKQRIWDGPAQGRNGSETQHLKQSKMGRHSFNPYILDNRYLDLFQITFTNTSSEMRKVSVDDFQFLVGEESYAPYKLGFFESSFQKQRERIENIHRLNMPQELTIPPAQTITKYLAIPRIPTDENLITIRYLENEKYTDFKYEHRQTLERKTEDFIKYKIPSVDNLSAESYFFLVNYKDSETFTLIDNEFYVNKEDLDSEVSLYGLVVNLSKQKTYFSELEAIKFSDFKKRVIHMDFRDLKKIKQE